MKVDKSFCLRFQAAKAVHRTRVPVSVLAGRFKLAGGVLPNGVSVPLPVTRLEATPEFSMPGTTTNCTCIICAPHFRLERKPSLQQPSVPASPTDSCPVQFQCPRPQLPQDILVDLGIPVLAATFLHCTRRLCPPKSTTCAISLERFS